MLRAGYQCEVLRPSGLRCSATATDVHHIVSRDVAPEGGYVAENGIACCFGCHNRAEQDALDPGGLYGPRRLRAAIGQTPRDLAALLLAISLGRALSREQELFLRGLSARVSSTKAVAYLVATLAADWRDLATSLGSDDWREARGHP